MLSNNLGPDILRPVEAIYFYLGELAVCLLFYTNVCISLHFVMAIFIALNTLHWYITPMTGWAWLRRKQVKVQASSLCNHIEGCGWTHGPLTQLKPLVGQPSLKSLEINECGYLESFPRSKIILGCSTEQQEIIKKWLLQLLEKDHSLIYSHW